MIPGQAEARLLRIALNRLGEKGRWNLDELRLEMAERVIEDVPLEVTGFSEIELGGILLEEEQAATEAGPLVPGPNTVPVARPGDMFCRGPYRLLCRGIELDPRCVYVVVCRYQDVTGVAVTLADTGESFEAVAQRRENSSD